MTPNNPDLQELKRWLRAANQDYSPKTKAAKQDAYRMVTSFVPALLERLERAEEETTQAIAEESRHWVDIIRRLDPENLCDYFDGLGNEEHLRQWLAARDASMKREGAAEWLENAAREGGYYERSSEGMLEEAKQLREKK